MASVKNWKQLTAAVSFKMIDKQKEAGKSWEEIADDLNKKKVRRTRQSKSWSPNATREFYYRERKSRGPTPKLGRPPQKAKDLTVHTREGLYEEIANLRQNDFGWDDIARHLHQNGLVHEMWMEEDEWTGKLVEDYFLFCEFRSTGTMELKISSDLTVARLGDSDRINNLFFNGHFIRIEDHEGAFTFEVHSKDTHKFSTVTAAKPETLSEESATSQWKPMGDSKQASAA
jgi:hypothetical protein